MRKGDKCYVFISCNAVVECDVIRVNKKSVRLSMPTRIEGLKSEFTVPFSNVLTEEEFKELSKE